MTDECDNGVEPNLTGIRIIVLWDLFLNVDILSVAARKLRTLQQIGAWCYTYVVGTA
jgi:hypothetical protein